jgi:hypothetical protein
MAQISFILGAVYAAVGVFIIGLSIPLLLGKIAPNRWYGFPLHQCRNSPEAWYAINRFGAKWMIGWAVALIILGIAVILFPLPKPGLIVPYIMFVSALTIVPMTATWRYALKFDK